MLKKTKISTLILLITIIIIGIYFFISLSIGNQKYINLKSLLNVKQKELIKKYIFPYKFISQQQHIISQLQQKINLNFTNLELSDKEKGTSISTFK